MSKTRAVAYLRVSTEKQVDKGVSLDAQRAKVEAYAQLYELDLVEVVVDAGVSAKTLDRPGLGKALGMLKAKQAEALLVVKLDRLTRSGEYTGGDFPYGFRLAPDGEKLVENAEEQKVLTAARRLRSAGLSLRSVARELNSEGFRSRTGKQFAHVQSARMLA